LPLFQAVLPSFCNFWVDKCLLSFLQKCLLSFFLLFHSWQCIYQLCSLELSITFIWIENCSSLVEDYCIYSELNLFAYLLCFSVFYLFVCVQTCLFIWNQVSVILMTFASIFCLWNLQNLKLFVPNLINFSGIVKLQ